MTLNHAGRRMGGRSSHWQFFPADRPRSSSLGESDDHAGLIEYQAYTLNGFYIFAVLAWLICPLSRGAPSGERRQVGWPAGDFQLWNGTFSPVSIQSLQFLFLLKEVLSHTIRKTWFQPSHTFVLHMRSAIIQLQWQMDSKYTSVVALPGPNACHSDCVRIRRSSRKDITPNGILGSVAATARHSRL